MASERGTRRPAERGGRASEAVRPAAGRPPAAARDRRVPPASRVRVSLLLDADALADLETLVAYRHGGTSRSAVVRGAIEWLRAKEAGWLLRARRSEELRARAAAELEEARRSPRSERDARATDAAVARALAIVRAEVD